MSSSQKAGGLESGNDERVFRFCLGIVLGGLLLSTGFATLIELSGNYGVIESPGYPKTYPAGQNITWRISAPQGYQVVVYFSVFDLEDSYDQDRGGVCVYDYVQVQCFSNIQFNKSFKISIAIRNRKQFYLWKSAFQNKFINCIFNHSKINYVVLQ